MLRMSEILFSGTNISETATILVNDTIMDESSHIHSSLGNDNDISNNDAIKSIEQELQEALQSKPRNNEDSFKLDVFKNLLLTLQEKVASLTADVDFLRQDSLNKASIIDKLVDIINIKVNNDYNNKKNHADNKIKRNNTSSYNESISLYNLNVSNGNNNSNIKNRKNVNPGNNFETSTPVAMEDKKKCTQNQSINNINDYVKWKDNKESVNSHVMKTKLYVINSIYSKPLEKQALWKKGTTLIIGDSLLYGIDESRLRNTKVRVYPGSGIEDMHYNIYPLLRKKPANVILHVGTNNATHDNSVDITVKLLKLKNFILEILPTCNVIFSSLIDRLDDEKAKFTVRMVNTNMKKRGMEMIDNDNITRAHLGKKGLHLTPYGTGRLAINIISALKKL